ncbi:hypothetical protein ACFE04_016044 [Oxalis oulophora]
MFIKPSVFIILQFLISNVKSQDTSNPDIFSNALHPFKPSLALILGILSVMGLITFLVLAYKFCCTKTSDQILTPDQHFDEILQSRSRFSGIDRSLIESLPFFRFSSLKGSRDGLECAICISKFEETETLRLLTKCSHAFHLNCIDKWLESHSSCPLCRYKIDIKNFSSRFSNLTEDASIEVFVRRHQVSSGIDPGENEEELLIQESGDREILHKFKHKIIVSDFIIRNRWSEADSSDLLFLNSKMLGINSRNRFSSSNSNNPSFPNEGMNKFKEDIEKKRIFEAKLSRIEQIASVSSPSFHNVPSNILSTSEKRSMSEITILSRFRENNEKNRPSVTRSGDNGVEERVRRVWLPIAQQTIQWFAGREGKVDESQNQEQDLNV